MTGNDRLRLILMIASAAVVLGVVSAIGMAANLGGARARSAPPWISACPIPSLTGTVVDVTLTDMGGMMGPGMMGPGMMGNNGYPWPGMGMMRLVAAPSTVPAGPVSLRVHNNGALTHEVVVLPLGPAQYAGQRAIGVDGRVDESGSVGEASQTCGADQGDGIAAGANAWTVIDLQPGRYELLCNIAGHYGGGMYADLDARQ